MRLILLSDSLNNPGIALPDDDEYDKGDGRPVHLLTRLSEMGATPTWEEPYQGGAILDHRGHEISRTIWGWDAVDSINFNRKTKTITIHTPDGQWCLTSNPRFLGRGFRIADTFTVQESICEHREPSRIEKVPTPGTAVGHTIVLVNPTLQNVKDFSKNLEDESMRYLIDKDTKDLYIWDAAYSIHASMANRLGLDYNNCYAYYLHDELLDGQWRRLHEIRGSYTEGIDSSIPLPDDDEYNSPRRQAHYTIISTSEDYWPSKERNYLPSICRHDRLIIRDENGPMSITNDAENVVRELYSAGQITNDIQLLYIDTMGSLDELEHQDGEFTGFGPGPQVTESINSDIPLPDDDEYGNTRPNATILLNNSEGQLAPGHPNFQAVYAYLNSLFNLGSEPYALTFTYENEPGFIWTFETPESAWHANTHLGRLLEYERAEHAWGWTININGEKYYSGSWGTNVDRFTHNGEIVYLVENIDSGMALPDDDEYEEEDLENWAENARSLVVHLNNIKATITDESIDVLNAYGHGKVRTYAINAVDLSQFNESIANLTRWVLLYLQEFPNADGWIQGIDPKSQTIHVGDNYGVQLTDDGWVGPIDMNHLL